MSLLLKKNYKKILSIDVIVIVLIITTQEILMIVIWINLQILLIKNIILLIPKQIQNIMYSKVYLGI